MKVCSLCGDTYREHVDFCFNDGEVLGVLEATERLEVGLGAVAASVDSAAMVPTEALPRRQVADTPVGGPNVEVDEDLNELLDELPAFQGDDEDYLNDEVTAATIPRAEVAPRPDPAEVVGSVELTDEPEEEEEGTAPALYASAPTLIDEPDPSAERSVPHAVQQSRHRNRRAGAGPPPHQRRPHRDR